jgi:flagellar hook-basal body complex protein FliE
MQNKFIPKINLPDEISGPKLSAFNQPTRMKEISDDNSIPAFKDVLMGMGRDLNSTVKATDNVLQSAISENGADIHDVMLALSKSELNVSIATQITTKVIQAYEKVMSIQV